MPKIGIASGQLDLTVPAGAFVGWLNNTSDYSFVRHTAASPKFNSSPGPGTGIRVGEVFTHQFDSTGVFPYTTSTGGGTITVESGPGPGTPAA
jgi:hypothetical protein